MVGARAARDRRLELRRPGAARPPAAPRRGTRCAASSRSRTRCRRRSRSCARRCSARCSTPPAHNVARNGPDVAIFESGTVYRAARRGAPLRRRAPRARRAADRRARARASWRGEPAAGRLLRRQGAAGGAARRASRVDWSVERARAWPFLHPGRSAAVLAGGAASALGFLGELHPLVAGAWDLAAHGRVRGRPRQARRAGARRSSRSGRSRRSPRCARTSRCRCPTTVVPPATVLERVRAAAGEMLETCACSTSTRGEQVGRGPALARAGARVPRARAHADRRGRRAACASGSSPRWRELGGELRG